MLTVCVCVCVMDAPQGPGMQGNCCSSYTHHRMRKCPRQLGEHRSKSPMNAMQPRCTAKSRQSRAARSAKKTKSEEINLEARRRRCFSFVSRFPVLQRCTAFSKEEMNISPFMSAGTLHAPDRFTCACFMAMIKKLL